MRNVLSFLLVFISVGTLFPQSKGSALLDSIAKAISSNENLTIEWETSFITLQKTADAKSKITHYIKTRVDQTHSAKIKGQRYMHKVGLTTIICDGEMVYRNNSGSLDTIVSHCDTTSDYNPIKVLTFFGNGYEVKKIRKHKSGKIGSIRIKTIDPLANLIKEAIIYFDEPGTLRFIEFKTKRKFSNYVKIKKFDSSIVLKDSEFEIPK